MRGGVVVGVLLGLPAAALLVMLALPKDGGARATSAPAPTRGGTDELPPGPALASPSDPSEPGPAPKSEAPPEHVPGSGRLVPFDLTRVAPREVGEKPWARWITTADAWKTTFESLHRVEWRRPDPVNGDPPPPAFDLQHEGVLVVGLGMKPRMDYDLLLEPVTPRYGEVRYRMKVESYLGAVTEVATWPAQAYRIPKAPVEARGLTVVDADDNEILAVPPKTR